MATAKSITLTSEQCAELYVSLRGSVEEPDNGRREALELLAVAQLVETSPAIWGCETAAEHRRLGRVEQLEAVARLANSAYWMLKRAEQAGDAEEFLHQLWTVGQVAERTRLKEGQPLAAAPAAAAPAVLAAT